MKLLDLFNFRKSDLPAITQGGGRKAVIALGGGGARGIAHLGVMQIIGESGVQTEQIVGVSMGSLVGAMCAADPNIRRVQANAIELLHSPIFKHKEAMLFGAASPTTQENFEGYFAWYGRMKQAISAHRTFRRAVTGPALMSESILQEAIDYLLPDIQLQDLATPLSVVAADLLSGHRVVIETGSLRQAVRASTAIPEFFPPVKWDDMLLCDIGVVDSLPITVARSYASDLVIGVDVGQEHTAIHKCDTALDVLMRMEDIGERLMRRHVMEESDIVIRPNVGNTSWFDFSHPEVLIAAGRSAAKKALAQLQDGSIPVTMPTSERR